MTTGCVTSHLWRSWFSTISSSLWLLENYFWYPSQTLCCQCRLCTILPSRCCINHALWVFIFKLSFVIVCFSYFYFLPIKYRCPFCFFFSLKVHRYSYFQCMVFRATLYRTTFILSFFFFQFEIAHPREKLSEK